MILLFVDNNESDGCFYVYVSVAHSIVRDGRFPRHRRNKTKKKNFDDFHILCLVLMVSEMVLCNAIKLLKYDRKPYFCPTFGHFGRCRS